MNGWTVAGAVALTVIAVVMLATVGGYGITWDEQFQSAYGEQVIAWYQSGFQNDGTLRLVTSRPMEAKPAAATARRVDLNSRSGSTWAGGAGQGHGSAGIGVNEPPGRVVATLKTIDVPSGMCL